MAVSIILITHNTHLLNTKGNIFKWHFSYFHTLSMIHRPINNSWAVGKFGSLIEIQSNYCVVATWATNIFCDRIAYKTYAHHANIETIEKERESVSKIHKIKRTFAHFQHFNCGIERNKKENTHSKQIETINRALAIKNSKKKCGIGC